MGASTSCSTTMSSRHGTNPKYTLSGSMSETYVSGGADNYSTLRLSVTLSASNISFKVGDGGTISAYWHDNRTGNNTTVASADVNSCGMDYGSRSASGTIKVTHNSDGSASGYMGINWSPRSTSTYVPYAGSATSEGVNLTKIPRYASCIQSSTGKTETSINMKWTSDSTCDKAWYSLNNGSSWTAIRSVNATSGTYTIPNLTANTSYQIKTRVRRKDSQLTTDSSALTISTYDYPKVSIAPTFLIGDNPTIGIYNPLGRSCKIYLIGNDNNQKEIGTITTESISGINTAIWKTWLYNSIPNTKSGTYRIRIVVSALSRDNNFTGNNYSIRDDGSELPNFSESNWSYVANLTSLTNNNQAVINGNSQITFTVNTQATSSFGATITGYIYKWGSKSSSNGSVSAGDGTILEVDAVDSRGLIKATTKTLVSGSTYIPYTKPTLDYSSSYTHRTDGISTEVRITLKGNLSVVKFGESGINNAVSDCKYRVYNYSTNTWSGPYNIPANNFTLNENGVYRLSNQIIHANGSSGGFTSGVRYGIEIILKDGNGLLATLTTSLIQITDGKIARDVYQDGNGDYHQGINGLANENYNNIIYGKENITDSLYINGNKKLDSTIIDKDLYVGDTGKQLKDIKSNQQIFDLIYPVGSIYISINSVNPATLFGGTWEQLKDRFLVGAGDVYAPGDTGGEATHDHLYRVGYRPYYGALVGDDKKAIMLYDYRNRSWTAGANDTGLPDSNVINKALTKSENAINSTKYSVLAHTDKANNIPPYYAVYMWKRTA